MQYKLIIFDLGNVLINFNHWIATNKFMKQSNRGLDYIYNLLFDSEFTKSFEEGKITGEEFFFAVKKELQLDIDYNQFLPIWNEIFYLTSDNVEVYQLANVLKTRFKIIVLSNINQLHFEYLKNNFRIFDAFERIVLSYKVGARKPDTKIYKYALDLFSLSPQEAFYFDDRADLIEAAGRLSIKAIQFKTPSDLKSALFNAGILQPEKKTLVAGS